VWTERALDERLRAKFFPDAKQSHSLNYAIVRNGEVVLRRTLLLAEEGKPGEVASAPRFQATAEGRLILAYYAQGTDSSGKSVSENRVIEILANGETSPSVSIRFQKPFTTYFTATVRGGSPPSNTLEMFGQRAGRSLTMSYARVRLW
jgi:hypothetical protein